MTEVLHAWIEGEYVGYFERSDPVIPAQFIYDSGTSRHISLSLTQGEKHRKKAAKHFLDGLTPETPAARRMMQTLTRARSTDSWDLLNAVEGDLPGGILLHPEKDSFERGVPFMRPATEQSIASRIIAIHEGGTGYENPESPIRFSLAGVQGKFALARTSDGLDFWSDAATASTHIVKPAHKDHRGLNEVEAAALRLARNIGLDAVSAQVESFAGQETFITERFDRKIGSGDEVLRVHMEDVSQALGRSPEHKYDVTATEVVNLLREHSADAQREVRRFIEQLAFNVRIGNADAHAKNYSLLHHGGVVTLSPLYDTVPITLFPEFAQDLAMNICGKKPSSGVVPSDWVLFAKRSSLDSDMVLATVRSIDEGFLAHVEGTIAETELARFRRPELDQLIRQAERSLRLNPV